MTTKAQQSTLFHAMNLLVSLRREVLEIITAPIVNQVVQPDTDAISSQFDALESALMGAKNFVDGVSRKELETTDARKMRRALGETINVLRKSADSHNQRGEGIRYAADIFADTLLQLKEESNQ